MRLADLRRLPGNPKKHAEADVLMSVQRFGFADPIGIDERTGYISEGHGRLTVLERLKREGKGRPRFVDLAPDGEWLVPVLRGIAFADDNEAKAYVVAHNRTTELGGWDNAALAAMLQDVQKNTDAALHGTGFSAADLDRIVAKNRAPAPGNVRDVDVERAPVVTKPGDLWKLGPHRVLCGDSRDPVNVGRVLEGQSVDLVFTSPPYNCGLAYDEHDDTEVPWSEYMPLLRDILAAWVPRLAVGRAVAWNIGTSRRTHPMKQWALLEEFGLEYLRKLVWHKSGGYSPGWLQTRDASRTRTFSPNHVHEDVGIFTKGPPQHGAPTTFDETLMNDVFEVRQSESRRVVRGKGAKVEHPAPFPVGLPAVFIAHLADVGAVVADPFMGVGSTLLAAEQLGRVAVGCELSPRYVDQLVARWELLTGKSAERVPAA
jgi:DNA modification methylase